MSNENFYIGALAQWTEIGNGEVMTFALPGSGVRTVAFELMTNERVTVTATAVVPGIGAQTDADLQSWLVAVGEGHMEVKFVTQEHLFVTVTGPEGCSIFMKTRMQTQVLPESDEPTFTTLQPSARHTSDRVSYQQQLAQRNQMKRAATLLAELNAAERRLAERHAVIEEAPKPKPPKPETSPAPDPETVAD